MLEGLAASAAESLLAESTIKQRQAVDPPLGRVQRLLSVAVDAGPRSVPWRAQGAPLRGSVRRARITTAGYQIGGVALRFHCRDPRLGCGSEHGFAGLAAGALTTRSCRTDPCSSAKWARSARGCDAQGRRRLRAASARCGPSSTSASAVRRARLAMAGSAACRFATGRPRAADRPRGAHTRSLCNGRSVTRTRPSWRRRSLVRPRCLHAAQEEFSATATAMERLVINFNEPLRCALGRSHDPQDEALAPTPVLDGRPRAWDSWRHELAEPRHTISRASGLPVHGGALRGSRSSTLAEL